MHYLKRPFVIALVCATSLIGGIIGNQAFNPVQAANAPGATELFLGRPDRVYNSLRNAGTAYVLVEYKPSSPACWEGVHVNITVAEASGNGFITAWGPGSRPGTSNVNYGPSAPAGAVSNSSAVETYVSSNGSIYFKMYNSARARVIVDVQGVYLDC